MTLKEIEDALRKAGLSSRGAFHPAPKDKVPGLIDKKPTKTLVLAGNAGPDMWAQFCTARDPAVDLLDDWSRDVLESLAQSLGAVALYPFQRPYLPFQRWAEKAEPCHISPLGIFIHSDHGLWHGYRGALAFAEHFELPPMAERPSPCIDCQDQPCLTACPAGAFSNAGYDVPACARHLGTINGSDCMELGCRARRACPEGQAARYKPAQAQFHMRAFLKRYQNTDD